jgi:hypothetical protein
MSTYYKVVDSLCVSTHGGALDLFVDSREDEDDRQISTHSPQSLAEVGVRLIEIAMLNDYSGEGCTIDKEKFKKWVIERVGAL